MKKFFKKHKRILAAIICIIIALAMILGPMAAFFF